MSRRRRASEGGEPDDQPDAAEADAAAAPVTDESLAEAGHTPAAEASKRVNDDVPTVPEEVGGEAGGDAPPPVGDAIAAGDAETARLRARVAELEAKYEPKGGSGDGSGRRWKVAAPGTALPEREVTAADKAAAVAAYKAACGVWDLPAAAEAVPVEPAE